MAPRLQSETARQRELYKYWQPNETIFPSAAYDESFNRDYQPRPSYDSALTAYAQLGALRCNAKRGMISVVDQSYQYIIAEGTKTLSLQDGSVVDQDDQLWFGLRTIPRSIGICATALGQFTTVEAYDGSVSDVLFEPLQFIIPDLSKDPRFTNQPFVYGAPYLRFYAGVPIRSPAGYIIGIYSIVDDKPREDFGERDLNVLKDLAATVMDHLVLGTVRGRHNRADRMVKGLGLFVDGKSTLRDWWLRSGYLGKGPTTKDGSRGGWTLAAQADAEFGPQVDVAFRNDTSREPREEQDGLASKLVKITTSGGNPALSGLLDTALCFASGGPPALIPSMSGRHHPCKIIQDADSGKLGAANSSSPGHAATDTVALSPATNSVASSSTWCENEDDLEKPGTETLSMSQNMGTIFKRASNLIRESITVEGCLFLDAGPAAIEDTPILPRAGKGVSTQSRSMSFEREFPGEEKGTAFNFAINAAGLGRESGHSAPDLSSHGSVCELLGSSLKFDPYLSDGETKPEFKFPKEFLHRLFKRYPNGSILNFEHDGSVSSSEEDLQSGVTSNLSPDEGNPKPRSKETKSSLEELDAKIIRDTFPGIRCLAFFPLWDTSTKTWFCGALAWTNDPLRILDPDDDMAYLAAFGNSIMAEKARLDASMADRMKGNFISTVSHELRSPLHGILASAELLKDMPLGPGQIDMVKMINTCGRTLLDTINHVLDFTELNRLRNPKLSGMKKPGSQDLSKTQNHPNDSLANPLQNLDLGILIEEVVDSTLAGYDFGRSGSAAMSSSDPEISFSGLEIVSHGKEVLLDAKSCVKIILDIDRRSSWVSAIQPGAWRRIVMNIFGNALKYTQAGCICISLKSIPSVSKQDSRPSVILTVSDTGKGISKQFLKHHVFTPFLQEDTLATGTGLGLSIVQQIVHDLEGQIEIQSEAGSGTKITVQVPFGDPTPSASPSHHNGDFARLESVRQKMKGLKVYIASSKDWSEGGKDGVSRIPQTEAACGLSTEKSLRKTLKHWFELEIVEGPTLESAKADVYLLLEDGSNCLRTQGGNDSLAWTPKMNQLASAKALIVLGTSQASSVMRASKMRKAIPFIQQPFGPYKLTRAFKALLKERELPSQPLLSLLDSIPIKELPLGVSEANSESLDNTSSGAKVLGIENDYDSKLDSSTTLITLIQPSELPINPQLPTVLLVEDNAINLKLLTMYMRKLKYPYLTAVNGFEALQTFKENPLSIRFILMDITMPVMDGLAATREIRRHERELGLRPTTIVALTGASSADAREKAISSGVNRFLTKPVPLKVVREIIKE